MFQQRDRNVGGVAGGVSLTLAGLCSSLAVPTQPQEPAPIRRAEPSDKIELTLRESNGMPCAGARGGSYTITHHPTELVEVHVQNEELEELGKPLPRSTVSAYITTNL